MGIKKWLLLLGALVFICLPLLGCESIAETKPPVYTVTYILNGKELSAKEVEQNTVTTHPEIAVAGGKFYGWQSESGEYIPDEAAVTADVVYHGTVYGDLSAHEPYLFANQQRFLRPDAPISCEEFSIAINMLAKPGAEKYLPELPLGAEPITAEFFKSFLSYAFPPELTAKVLPSLEGDTVTRGNFAVIMNQLLGRTEETAVTGQLGMLPYDMSANREDFRDLAEATYHHTHGANGESWDVLTADKKNPSGFFLLDGYLYHIDESGNLTVNADLGVLHFGPDGRYTTTDSELDAMVAEILSNFMKENPEADRAALLRLSFDYSWSQFQYLRRSAYLFGQTGWEIEDAKKMFSTGRGNCYSFAAIFWALARGLGYEANAVSGTMTLTKQPHSWVEIPFDGEMLLFDPELQWSYRIDRKIPGKDMFMVPYDTVVNWNYRHPDWEE